MKLLVLRSIFLVLALGIFSHGLLRPTHQDFAKIDSHPNQTFISPPHRSPTSQRKTQLVRQITTCLTPFLFTGSMCHSVREYMLICVRFNGVGPLTNYRIVKQCRPPEICVTEKTPVGILFAVCVSSERYAQTARLALEAAEE